MPLPYADRRSSREAIGCRIGRLVYWISLLSATFFLITIILWCRSYFVSDHAEVAYLKDGTGPPRISISIRLQERISVNIDRAGVGRSAFVEHRWLTFKRDVRMYNNPNDYLGERNEPEDSTNWICQLGFCLQKSNDHVAFKLPWWFIMIGLGAMPFRSVKNWLMNAKDQRLGCPGEPEDGSEREKETGPM